MEQKKKKIEQDFWTEIWQKVCNKLKNRQFSGLDRYTFVLNKRIQHFSPSVNIN